MIGAGADVRSAPGNCRITQLGCSSAPPSVQRNIALLYSSGRWESKGLGGRPPRHSGANVRPRPNVLKCDQMALNCELMMLDTRDNHLSKCVFSRMVSALNAVRIAMIAVDHGICYGYSTGGSRDITYVL